MVDCVPTFNIWFILAFEFQNGEEVSSWLHNHAPEAPHPANELGTFSFAKHYNVRPRSNTLPGSNCEMGQLVPAGHEQHE